MRKRYDYMLRLTDPDGAFRRSLKMASALRGETINDFCARAVYAALDKELSSIQGPNWWRDNRERAAEAIGRRLERRRMPVPAARIVDDRAEGQ